MALSTAQIQQHLDAWYAADLAVATSQSYSITTATGSRTLTRTDSAEIKRNINYWEGKMADAQAAAKGNPRGGFISTARFTR